MPWDKNFVFFKGKEFKGLLMIYLFNTISTERFGWNSFYQSLDLQKWYIKQNSDKFCTCKNDYNLRLVVKYIKFGIGIYFKTYIKHFDIFNMACGDIVDSYRTIEDEISYWVSRRIYVDCVEHNTIDCVSSGININYVCFCYTKLVFIVLCLQILWVIFYACSVSIE